MLALAAVTAVLLVHAPAATVSADEAADAPELAAAILPADDAADGAELASAQPALSRMDAGPLASSPGANPRGGPSLTIPLAHGAGLMAGMRLSLSALWPDAFHPFPVNRSLATWRQNVSRPPELRRDVPLHASDGDPWSINIAGHGLFGSELYLRARLCGHRPLAAFATTAALSTFWEYGVEAFHKRPSAFDLAWTPLSGALLGELRFRLYRAARVPALRALVDPLGEAERALGAGC